MKNKTVTTAYGSVDLGNSPRSSARSQQKVDPAVKLAGEVVATKAAIQMLLARQAVHYDWFVDDSEARFNAMLEGMIDKRETKKEEVMSVARSYFKDLFRLAIMDRDIVRENKLRHPPQKKSLLSRLFPE
jgi:hypothetical protein